jgi:hypothetical protein
MAGRRMENGDYVYTAWVLQHRYVLSGGGEGSVERSRSMISCEAREGHAASARALLFVWACWVISGVLSKVHVGGP